LKHLIQTFALGFLALALAAPMAEAGTAKRKNESSSIVKRDRVSKTFHKQPQQQAVAKQARRSVVRVQAPPPRPSFGQLAGLHGTQDDLDLKSSVALVIDAETSQVLLRKNDSAVLPIASITKLMTGLIISEAKLPMEEPITITQDDVDTEKGSSSRLKVGTTLTRGELMHLSLMSSENRAAHALGRTYPGGMSAFVEAMNARAQLLGMRDTRYVEPTGLSSRNQSSAQDLARLVGTAANDPLLREWSTSPGHEVEVGNKTLKYNNTNRLVRNPEWEVGLQKTGYISEAGQCLVMQAKVAGRKLIMVFLDSAGKLSRIGDAERVRKWVETNPLPLTIQTPAGMPLPGGNTLIRQVNG
jgi:D-alanyl-D-alanine endopeptidase (penicillin-binding protein 7)